MIGYNSYSLSRRSMLMFGFTLGCAINRSGPVHSQPLPIVAWGDSLTQGGYPALAGALFSPPRTIVNKGIGGQGTYSIAARQGGRPITVTVSGNAIPARQDWVRSWDFETSTEGWHGNGITHSDGKLFSTVTGTPQGMTLDLGRSLAQGRLFTVEFDITVPTGMIVRCSGINSGVWAANNGAGVNGFEVTTSGRYRATLYAGNTGGNPATMPSLGFLTVGASAPGTFAMDKVVMTIPPVAADYAVAITARNNNILTQGGSFAGTSPGTLAGVHGTMTTDSNGNWTFTRDAMGPAVPCPAGSRFIPDEAVSYRDHTAWLWAGNNGIADAATAAAAKADIAAMIAHLGHDRYLVASVIVSSDHPAARVAVLQQMNADLAALYGSRFVDVYGKLRAAGNGSAEDNGDIAAGYIPRSLRTDGIHLNATGNAVTAQAIHEAHQRMGW
jgi:lysophospholipase L1-like esterase